MDIFNNNTSNSTLSVFDENAIHKERLKKAADILSFLAICVIMLAMGTDISWKNIWEHLRRPVTISIGMLSQFLFMPLVGFSFIKATNLSPSYSISVLLMSCCPGGSVSNVFTYFIDGDVALSVTMTTLSTLFALGLMPFNLWFYGMWIETGKLMIPYASMAISLTYVTSPLALGMIIGWKFHTIALWITKVFSILGFVLIGLSVILQSVAYPEMITDIPLQLYIAAIAIPSAGSALGFSLAWFLKRPIAIMKTISIESGIQNVPVAIGVILVSPFEVEVEKLLLCFPSLYGISMISLSILLCSFYQLHKRVCKKSNSADIQGDQLNDTVYYIRETSST